MASIDDLLAKLSAKGKAVAPVVKTKAAPKVAVAPEVVEAVVTKIVAKVAKGKSASKEYTLADGSVLEVRVAAKGYGCVGFVNGNQYASIWGYQERMVALCILFGPGFQEIVAWMLMNGLKPRSEVFATVEE